MKANNLEAAKSQLQAKGINFDLDSIDLNDKDASRYNIYVSIDSKSSVVDGQLNVINLAKTIAYTRKAIDANRVIQDQISKSNMILVHDCLEYQIEKAKKEAEAQKQKTTGTGRGRKSTKSEE